MTRSDPDSANGTVWRTVLLTLGGVAVIAGATAWLRAAVDWWWPAFDAALGGRLAQRFVWLLAVALVAPLLGLLDWKLGWSRWHLGAVVLAGLLIGYVAGGLLRADSHTAPTSWREHAYRVHLLGVVQPHMRSHEIRGGLMAISIPVVDADRAAAATMKLRQAIVEGDDLSFLHRIITVGGPDTELVDAALRKAVRWLPQSRRGNIEIYVVTPSPIAEGTAKRLEGKGLKIRYVEHQFPDRLAEENVRAPAGRPRRR